MNSQDLDQSHKILIVQWAVPTDQIIGSPCRRASVRDIQACLEDLCGLRLSPDLIGRVTDAVLDEVRKWQHRPLDRRYPVVIFDALRVKHPQCRQPDGQE